MTVAPRLVALSALVLMAGCHTAPATNPAQSDPDFKAVLGFFNAYSNRDLDEMMKFLDEGALFQGPGTTLTRQQIRDFFQKTLQKYPNLKIETGSPKRVQNTIQVSVKVETNSISINTWIFEMNSQKIHSYSVAPSIP